MSFGNNEFAGERPDYWDTSRGMAQDAQDKYEREQYQERLEREREYGD